MVPLLDLLAWRSHRPEDIGGVVSLVKLISVKVKDRQEPIWILNSLTNTGMRLHTSLQVTLALNTIVCEVDEIELHWIGACSLVLLPVVIESLHIQEEVFAKALTIWTPSAVHLLGTLLLLHLYVVALRAMDFLDSLLVIGVDTLVEVVLEPELQQLGLISTISAVLAFCAPGPDHIDSREELRRECHSWKSIWRLG